MDLLRTPDDRFRDLPGFPHEPRYALVPDGDGGELRMAYVDVGPPDGPTALLLHGEPSWSFLYRTVLDVLVERGIRCVVPDLVGFGRSDKPAQVADHTYARHVAWVRALCFDALDLREVTLVGQDWGGLIGLRLVAEHPDRFAGVVAANTGLPTGDHNMPEVWWRFRRAVETVETLDVGRLVAAGCARPMSTQVRAAYDAPFPDESFKAGPRAMPTLVPTAPDDPATEANRAAWETLTHLDLPFLVAFSDGDPITAAMGPILARSLRGARGLEHPVLAGGGHFLQEDVGADLGAVVAAFVESRRPSVFERAGGEPAFLALARAHHARCLADPVLSHPFSHGDLHPQHVERLGWYWAEVMGGPPRYTEAGGGQSQVLHLHAMDDDLSDLARRFLACFLQAADDAGLPADPELRGTLEAYLRWALADLLSWHDPDTVPPGRAVPRWTWDGLEA